MHPSVMSFTDWAIGKYDLKGKRVLEIGRRLGSTRNSIGVELAQMRADGWDLPHRHRGYDRP